MLNKNGQSQENKLDLEFRRILRIIKPYIPYITNNEYLCSYRTWLEKLSESDYLDKEERNHYLTELCRQIQEGVLEVPFRQPPPVGLLPPFKLCMRPYKDQIEQNVAKETFPLIQEYNNTRVPHKKRHWHTVLKDNESTKQPYNAQQTNYMDDYVLNAFQSQAPIYNFSVLPDTQFNMQYKTCSPGQTNRNEYNEDQCLSASKNVNNITPNSFSVTPNPKDINRQQTNLFNVGNKNLDGDDTNDDHSWYDISEVSSTTKLESGDSLLFSRNRTKNISLQEMYENKITDLTNVIDELKKQNISLMERVTKYERDLSLRNSKAETSICNLAGEVKALKTRLQDLTEIKTAIKNNQYVATSQWQNTIETLNKKLIETCNENSKLKENVNILEKKVGEFLMQRQTDYANIRQKLHNVHNKELEMLKQNHAQHITDVELGFGQVLANRENEFDKKIEELRDAYENKISQIKLEYEKTLQGRNAEIERLEVVIENQCKRMHEEVLGIRNQMQENTNLDKDYNAEKIYLQKHIIKMDKLLKKSEKEYLKQLTKLKRELEIKDKTMQIQLTTQRAELIATTTAERRLEIDAAVTQLEEKYRKLLQQQQESFLREREHDAELISEFKTFVEKTNTDIYSLCNDL